jgi:hypothetical protein
VRGETAGHSTEYTDWHFRHGAGVDFGVKWVPSDGVPLRYLVLPTCATFLRRRGRGEWRRTRHSLTHGRTTGQDTAYSSSIEASPSIVATNTEIGRVGSYKCELEMQFPHGAVRARWYQLLWCYSCYGR